MGKRSVLWEYFHDTTEKHRNNKSHNLVICLNCLEHVKAGLEKDETHRLVSHELVHRSTDKELKCQGTCLY